ncbi:MAG: flagellar biosynthetic protein FliQ [Plesiomonas sp.]|uniref:flagellar biosynthetic protein FliQ n=1 Tax=Plesiomonas sp. TaxID=2486279 RepID=UPI003F3242B5
MDTTVIAIIFGQALTVIATMVCILVLPSLVVGLIVSIFQAATQINEQTLSFLPRFLVMLAMIGFSGSWMLTTLHDLFTQIFLDIPTLIG